jgi:hypothetical protein
MPELSVKSPFNLYHATKFAHSAELVHAVDELAPAALEVVPAGHETHAAKELAPVVAEYVPVGQDVQTLAPVTPEYVPAAQFTHTVVPNWPAGHVCACKRDRPDKFCEQFSAESDPTSEDDPAGNCTHAPPFGP